MSFRSVRLLEMEAAIVDRLLADGGFGAAMRNGKGVVIWLTGLSGAGKTTVSRILSQRFSQADLPCVVLDGDELRALLAADQSHGVADRHKLAMTYGRLCRDIAGRGVHVICATISMFQDVRDWNRQNIDRYVEVYLRVPLDELKRRDPKGLYAKAAAGVLSDIVGVHLPADEPRTPDLTIDSHWPRRPLDTAEEVVALLRGLPELRGLG